MLAQQTGESVEASYQLITSAGGWQQLASSTASSVWNMLRHPILSAKALWGGMSGQVTGVRDAVNSGNASTACQRAVSLSAGVIGAVDGVSAARASLSNLRRVANDAGDIAFIAERKVARETPATPLVSFSYISTDIARGHAFEKHVLGIGADGDFYSAAKFRHLGVQTSEQFASYIEKSLRSATEHKSLERGRLAYWNNNDGLVVIYDPARSDFGTAFFPDQGKYYYLGLK